MNEVANQETSANLIESVVGEGMQNVTKSIQNIVSFQQIVKSQLKKDIDFGIISGTKKPTLLKPGAEKLLMILGLRSVYDVVDKQEDFDKGFFAYTVKASLYKENSLITEGLGAANTKETRYRKNEYDNNRKKQWDGISYQDPFTLQNTVLKMAKKRAQVDAALTVGSLSEVFTQDIEDMNNFDQREKSETMNAQDAQEFTFKSGKHKGQTFDQVIASGDGEYLDWMSQNSRSSEIKKAIALYQQSRGSQSSQPNQSQQQNTQNSPQSSGQPRTAQNAQKGGYQPTNNYAGSNYGSSAPMPSDADMPPDLPFTANR